MKRSARVFLFVGKKFFFFVASLLLISVILSPHANAQTPYDSNTNPDVPQNQHTRAQIAFIEGSAAIICQLAGIDIVQPEKGCLGVDQATRKIGYAPQAASEKPQIGGMLGLSASLLGTMYQPPASGVTYVAGVFDNFGIVKKTYAQEQPTGFDALSPVQKIWEVSRNITYALLVLVFIVIGLGIMLRVKIDPRTAMSIQNQVPRIIIAILLITFSYSIIGFMVDLMWLGTYAGINAVSSVTNETICSDGSNKELTVREGAYANLLNSPLAFMNDILKHPETTGPAGNPGRCDSGIKYLSLNVSYTAGNFITTLIQDLFQLKGSSCGFLDFSCTVENSLANFIGWIGQILMLLVAFLAILIVMFRLWWQLLKAYALIVFYTILGPFWILLGLLPNSERNFNSWLRTVTAKLASFPAAALMIVIARVILDSYGQPTSVAVSQSQYFIPPMVGNPNLGLLGPLLAFAILLLAPDVLNMLNDALKAPASKYVGPAIQGGVAAGFAAGAPVGFIARRGVKYDQSGQARGFIAAPIQRWASGHARRGIAPGEHAAPASTARRVRNSMLVGAAKGLNLALGGKNLDSGGGGRPSH